jgi:hypothetical protein
MKDGPDKSESKVKSMSKKEEAEKKKPAKQPKPAQPGADKAKKAKPAKPAPDAAAEAEKAAAKEKEKPKPPPRPPADPRLKVLKKFYGKFLPRGPLRDRHRALMARWESGEDHGGVTVEELKSLHEDWKAARAKPARKVAASV